MKLLLKPSLLVRQAVTTYQYLVTVCLISAPRWHPNNSYGKLTISTACGLACTDLRELIDRHRGQDFSKDSISRADRHPGFRLILKGDKSCGVATEGC